ncbi:MAG: translocation/assembly module TamB domain-containing protein, partial [bacterium]|nr:translocation/assembly module TamB domain-containing protein [bacterium]
PAGWGPAGAPVREFDARVVGLDLAGFAGAQALAGSVTGSATLRGDALFGRLATDALTLGGRTAPAQFEFQGDVDADAGPSLSGRLDIGGAEADLLVDRRGVDAYVRLERFPLHELVAAAFGPSDVVAEVTGAMRGAWAWGADAPSGLRVASERIRLERAGVETRGQLSFEWDGESLTIGEAAFEGRGEWRVRGRATPDLLDLELLASAADFGPLLGLVPAFAQYGVTAQGDLALSARGTPAAPDVLLRTEDLELGVAGTRYRLDDVRVTLQGEAWTGRAKIVAVAPLTGRVTMVSDGRVGPFPAGTFSLAARAIGELDVPFVGRVDELVADLAWSDQQAPTLRAAGRLGAPFAVTGSLSPLDLHATGRDLNLAIPFLFVADATVDADLRLRASSEGVNLSGRVDASQARVDLGARQGAAPVDGADATDTGTPEPGPAVVGDARERFRFDAVRVVAPQRVTFSESFGNAEAAVDLTLDGTAAAPRLSGAIRALRGTVRFAGRDLELSAAVATFDPTRGVLPSLSVVGRTSFDKARVVPPGEAIRFLAPAGPRFTVELQLAGEATLGTRGFALDLQPRLTSDALVDGVDAGGARPLSELELLTLVTLGWLEGSAGVAGAVAQSALDTAVELLVTAEIQAILAEALGVDVVELRTTTMSILLDGTDPFGVSLRLGGYLSEEVFASYRVSTLGGATFSNEVAFAYQLGPVAVDITGRIDVAAGAAATTPSLAVGARYGFAPGWALELGIDLSTERSTARLGVTWRW